MDIFYKKLSKKIKTIREKLGFSQETLAKELGISRVAISQIENGDRKISAEEIAKLSRVFNVPTDILLNLDKDIEVILEKNNEHKPKKKTGIRISVPQKNLEKFHPSTFLCSLEALSFRGTGKGQRLVHSLRANLS